jgi:hypothetical protein
MDLVISACAIVSYAPLVDLRLRMNSKSEGSHSDWDSHSSVRAPVEPKVPGPHCIQADAAVIENDAIKIQQDLLSAADANL